MNDDSILLFGGSSEERLVSVASAQNLARQYAFREIWYWHPDGSLSVVAGEELAAHQNAFEKEFKPRTPAFANHFDAALSRMQGRSVFLALHGTEGEDGALQAFFEKEKICFTGSGSNASRNAFVKDKAKVIVAQKGIPVAPQLIVQSAQDAEALAAFFQTHQKIVMKPLANGSSIGLHIIVDTETLQLAQSALKQMKYGAYLAEKFIEGRELTVGVFHDGKTLRVLPPSEVLLDRGHSFDYQGKYLGLGTTEITPAEISDAETEIVQALAKTAHQALGCYGYSRTDLLLTSTGPVFLETNTLPGLTKASFIPQQLAVASFEFTDFVKTQLALARLIKT